MKGRKEESSGFKIIITSVFSIPLHKGCELLPFSPRQSLAAGGWRLSALLRCKFICRDEMAREERTRLLMWEKWHV